MTRNDYSGYSLVIGRFQPLHNGHMEVLRKCAEESDHLIVGIGSAQISHDPDNPFTAGERYMMISESLKAEGITEFSIVPVEDLNRYSVWVAHVVSMVPPFKRVYTNNPMTRRLFEEAYEAVRDIYEKRYGVKYNITFTYQDKATDTVAVDVENRPFRTETDSLLFRPAGHGALIYNLNNIKEEVVSIKNIDNVANERLLPVTAKYKKVLLGKCLELRDRIFGYLRELDACTDICSEEGQALCGRIESFLDRELCIRLPEISDCREKADMLRRKLNRPIRVCGMVKNQGEPGGGPFVIAEKDGSTSLQILESVQINMSDEHARAALSSATHFNPVDLVCCLHDYKGQPFNLLEHVDHDAGFISSKSYQGRELKALELPGLWNGSMSDWNTMFVEVPLDTFNPVKVVLDLLRPAHQ